MEAIRIFLALSTYMNFIVFQIDVKSAFLNGKLKEEFYVKQPPSFESSEFHEYVYKLDKALYGLKQALRATLYSYKEMDLETVQNNVVAKLSLLKQGDYEMWKIRIEQYFQVQDYALWEVIENGNSFKPVARITANADGTSTSTIPGPVTTEACC
ncbi:ribonuclease H-like domain-containing protein [Tanacetum coccineum]